MIPINNFATRIKQLRISRGLTQYQLAIMADMGYSFYNKIELGYHLPLSKRAVNLVNVFGVGIEECLFDAPSNEDEKDKITNDILSLLNHCDNDEIEFLLSSFIRQRGSDK